MHKLREKDKHDRSCKGKCDKCGHFNKKIESVDRDYDSDESCIEEDDQMDDLAD